MFQPTRIDHEIQCKNFQNFYENPSILSALTVRKFVPVSQKLWGCSLFTTFKMLLCYYGILLGVWCKKPVWSASIADEATTSKVTTRTAILGFPQRQNDFITSTQEPKTFSGEQLKTWFNGRRQTSMLNYWQQCCCWSNAGYHTLIFMLYIWLVCLQLF